MNFDMTFRTRWADMDPNGHMRHSAYNDYAAHVRVSLFAHHGVSMQDLNQMRVGPVLFREETRFLKEFHLDDEFTVNCKIAAARPNGKIWMIRHEFFNHAGETAAIITVEGAWIDLDKRRVVSPPDVLKNIMNDLPKTDDFKELSSSSGQ